MDTSDINARSSCHNRIYAWRTHAISTASRKQAEASIRMAEEMREQRHDSVRPVIDFMWRDYSDANVNRVAWIAGMDGKVPTELSCKLRNVGFGPAIELYSFTIVGQDNRNHRDFGTLKAGGETDDWVALSVSQECNGGVLEAYYKDIHDNTCKSILEVYPVTGEGLRSKLRVKKCRSKPK